MIRAKLRQDRENRFTGFELNGHSGYAEEGSDIICAAVSILAFTCINSLESVCRIHPAVEGETPGRMKVTLPSEMTEAQRHDAQVILSVLQQGLRDLAESYPNYVQLSIVNGGKQP